MAVIMVNNVWTLNMLKHDCSQNDIMGDLVCIFLIYLNVVSDINNWRANVINYNIYIVIF